MKKTWIYTLAALCGLTACGPSDGDGGSATQDSASGTSGTSGTNGQCAYPEGANDVMTIGDVIATYSWNRAFHRSDRREATIDLAQVPCATDDDIDWSPFDVLLFVSIPAW